MTFDQADLYTRYLRTDVGSLKTTGAAVLIHIVERSFCLHLYDCPEFLKSCDKVFFRLKNDQSDSFWDFTLTKVFNVYMLSCICKLSFGDNYSFQIKGWISIQLSLGTCYRVYILNMYAHTLKYFITNNLQIMFTTS